MSTSPSWFDQDKFSRLVKKVGTKPAAAGGTASSGAAITRLAGKDAKPRQAPEAAARSATRISSSTLAPSVKASQPMGKPATAPLPPMPAPEPAAAETEPEVIEPEADENPLPDFPASIAPPEPRSVSPLSRRTTPLPNLKSLFEYDKTAAPGPMTPPGREIPAGPKQIDSKTEMPEPEADDRDMPWTAPGLPAEEPARPSDPESRPGEIDFLRGQLAQLDEITQERDDARREAELLRARLQQGDESKAGASASDEVTRAIEDRDSARRDYANLREQFETMKAEQFRLRNDGSKKDPDAQREIESLRAQIAARDEELNAMKLDPLGVDPEVDSLREEADVLQKQLNQAREEASIAQRGLALSQKALQETRDALREATEGSSQMKTSLESLKNECATLVQQNMLLQAQHDQLSREISTLRTKSLVRPSAPA
jgi:hypothetical protein